MDIHGPFMPAHGPNEPVAATQCGRYSATTPPALTLATSSPCIVLYMWAVMIVMSPATRTGSATYRWGDISTYLQWGGSPMWFRCCGCRPVNDVAADSGTPSVYDIRLLLSFLPEPWRLCHVVIITPYLVLRTFAGPPVLITELVSILQKTGGPCRTWLLLHRCARAAAPASSGPGRTGV